MEDEKHILHEEKKAMINERIRLGGKDPLVDFYGNPGRHSPIMGPNMSEKTCIVCGTSIEKLSLGGGQAYFCPHVSEIKISVLRKHIEIDRLLFV